MKTGIERIAAERQRQIEKEGWTIEHDDQHLQGELARAACCYAAPQEIYTMAWEQGCANTPALQITPVWPEEWEVEWDKRKRDKDGEVIDWLDLPTPERIRNLEKAGALIAAEIDRLLRDEAEKNDA